MSQDTSTTTHCVRCGTRLAREARGNCPACLARRLSADDETYSGPVPDGYTVGHEIGRGSAGVVLKAHHVALGRDVALKVLMSGRLAGEAERARLRREAEAMARLRHPHIVAIHEVGEIEGYLFLAMDFIQGGTLADRLRAGPIEPRLAAGLLHDIANAVAHAHERGVIHRDLKPANILLDELGAPHLADFGLAKLLPVSGEHTPFDLTLTGQPMGTVHYLAPEQASGSPRQVTPAADVHSLGAVLYHCLTGRPPYLGDTFAETLHQVVHEDPPAPRVLNPAIPADLETICLKALHKSPARRYESAAAFRDDLNRFLRREAVWARPISRIERYWRWIVRNPAPSIAAVVILGTLAISTVFFRERAVVERRLRAEADQSVRALEFELLDKLIEKGQRDLALGSLARLARSRPNDPVIGKRLAWTLQEGALALPVRPPRMIGRWGKTSFTSGRWLAISDDQGRVEVQDLSGDVETNVWTAQLGAPATALQLSDDGAQLVVAQGSSLSLWTKDGRQAVYQPVEGSPVVDYLTISQDQRMLASRNTEGGIELWRLPDLAPVGLKGRQRGDFRGFSFSPNGRFLLTCSMEEQAQLWDVHSARLRRRLAAHGVHDWSRDGRQLLVPNNWEGRVDLWDVEEDKIVKSFGPIASPTCAVFSPKEQLIAIANFEGTLQLWNVRTGLKFKGDMVHPQWVRDLKFSPDGILLASLCPDGIVRIWLVETTQAISQPVAHAIPLKSLGFLADSRRFVTYSAAGWAGYWKICTPNSDYVHVDAELIKFPLVQRSVSAVLSNNGEWVATASGNGEVHLVKRGTPLLERKLVHADTAVHQMAFSDDGSLLATADANREVWLWKTDSGAREPLGRTGGVATGIHFSPNGKTLYVADDSGKVTIMSLTPEKPRREIDAAERPIFAMDVSPDGRWIATGGEDWVVKVWNADTAELAFAPIRLQETPSRLLFSQDGKQLFGACFDSHIYRWEIPSGREIQPALPMDGAIFSLAISQDGRKLLNACDDGFARLWQLPEGRLLRRFPMTGQMKAALSPDARTVATGNTDGSLRVWDVESGLALSSLIRQRKGWVEPIFLPSGDSVITASRTIEVREWPLPPVPTPVPTWLIDFSEALSGRETNAAGSVVAFDPKRQWQVVESGRRRSDNSELGRWFRKLLNE